MTNLGLKSCFGVYPTWQTLWSVSKLSGFHLRKCVLLLCVLSSVLHFSSCFRYQTFKQISVFLQFFTVINLATGIPSTAADHVCWQRSNLFLLENLWDSQISTSLVHLGFFYAETRESWSCPRRHVDVFPHTDPQSETGGGLSALFGSVSSPSVWGIHPFKS